MMAHANTNSSDLFWNAHSGLNKVAAEKQCRMCQRPKSVRPLTRHHLVPLRCFDPLREAAPFRPYRNANANIIPLCRPCHDLVESDREARRMLRKLLTQQEIAFAVKVMNLAWLNDHYPADKSAQTPVMMRWAEAHERKKKLWDSSVVEIPRSEKALARERRPFGRLNSVVGD